MNGNEKGKKEKKMTATKKAETYRRVNKSMGAWKWGYPRGHRYGIVRYTPSQLCDGTPVWKSAGEMCDGITAASEDSLRATYPEAFEYSVGSIHNMRIF